MPLASAAAAAAAAGGILLSTSGCACSLSLKRLPSRTLAPNLSIILPDYYQRPFIHKIHLKCRSPRLRFIAGAADSTQSSPLTTSADKPTVADDEISVTKVSFGTIGLSVGVTLLSYGFGAYFNILPGSEWSAIMLTYGFPLAIIGMALKYAELKPVPCLTYSDAFALREKCATPILKQVRSDVIRYRYGDEQHLEEALKRIFQYGQGGGIPRRSAPILQKIREEVTEDGRYALVLVFEAKALELSDFEQRQAKFTSFFGPGITAEIAEGGKDEYEVKANFQHNILNMVLQVFLLYRLFISKDFYIFATPLYSIVCCLTLACLPLSIQICLKFCLKL